MIANIYLVCGFLSLACSLIAVAKVQRIGSLVIPYFVIGWLTGDLALWWLLIQSLFAAAFIINGVLDSTAGQLGLLFFACSWVALLYAHSQSAAAEVALKSALNSVLGDQFRATTPDVEGRVKTPVNFREWAKPFSMKREGVRMVRDIAYGEAENRRNLLDLYLPESPREGGHPVILQVHGGAWLFGEKEQQAMPLMNHLAQQGWICVAINYRLSPASTFPDHIVDVKKAIRWIKEHIAEYGGNDFLAITGGSAGGHLSSLAALTPNLPRFQPGFEGVDTSIDAAVPFYGVYDFLDKRNILGKMNSQEFMEKSIFKCTFDEDPDLWNVMCTDSHLNEDAPPFFFIHGTHDTLAFIEPAIAVAAELKAISKNPVAFAELPGAQHAFDSFHSIRNDATVRAVHDFLEWAYASSECA